MSWHMKARGHLSWKALALSCGLIRGNFRGYAKSEQLLRDYQVERLCDGLGVTPAEMLQAHGNRADSRSSRVCPEFLKDVSPVKVEFPSVSLGAPYVDRKIFAMLTMGQVNFKNMWLSYQAMRLRSSFSRGVLCGYPNTLIWMIACWRL
jgi:hypothetical protein